MAALSQLFVSGKPKSGEVIASAINGLGADFTIPNVTCVELMCSSGPHSPKIGSTRIFPALWSMGLRSNSAAVPTSFRNKIVKLERLVHLPSRVFRPWPQDMALLTLLDHVGDPAGNTSGCEKAKR